MSDAIDDLPANPRVLAVATAAHRRAAYEAGYARALADVLSSAVFIAEQSLRSAKPPADPRAVLYHFVGRLEKEARRLASGEGDVSDGLGI